MKKSKKILLTAFLCFFLITFGFSFVWAQNGEPNVKDPVKRLEGIGAAAGFPQGSPTVAETIGGIIKTFISILGVIFMAYIVYAGYLWIIARGEEEKIAVAGVQGNGRSQLRRGDVQVEASTYDKMILHVRGPKAKGHNI